MTMPSRLSCSPRSMSALSAAAAMLIPTSFLGFSARYVFCSATGDLLSTLTWVSLRMVRITW